VASHVKNDRRAKLRAAAAKVRSTLKPEFRQLGAQEIMNFLRGADAAAETPRRGRR
jgi:antitoxin PrlF